MSRVLRQVIEEWVMIDDHAPSPPHFGPETCLEPSRPLACRRLRALREVERTGRQMLADLRRGGVE